MGDRCLRLSRIFVKQRWFPFLFLFYHHIEIISQSINPMVERLSYISHDSSISHAPHLLIRRRFAAPSGVLIRDSKGKRRCWRRVGFCHFQSLSVGRLWQRGGARGSISPLNRHSSWRDCGFGVLSWCLVEERGGLPSSFFDVLQSWWVEPFCLESPCHNPLS